MCDTHKKCAAYNSANANVEYVQRSRINYMLRRERLTSHNYE